MYNKTLTAQELAYKTKTYHSYKNLNMYTWISYSVKNVCVQILKLLFLMDFSPSLMRGVFSLKLVVEVILSIVLTKIHFGIFPFYGYVVHTYQQVGVRWTATPNLQNKSKWIFSTKVWRLAAIPMEYHRYSRTFSMVNEQMSQCDIFYLFLTGSST